MDPEACEGSCKDGISGGSSGSRGVDGGRAGSIGWGLEAAERLMARGCRAGRGRGDP